MKIPLTPHQISDKRLEMAEEYSRFSGEMAKLLIKQAEWFNKNRASYKSDTATQRAYDVTEDGVTLTVLKLKLKSIEKTMSAYNTHLRLLENESKNLY
jgi:hypothetical protein